MKRILFLVFVLSLCSGIIHAAGPVDGKIPAVEYGFQSLSPERMDAGELLLFDGRSFFGWEVFPMKSTRSEKTPDPTIEIKNGEMWITASVPLRLRTPILWSYQEKDPAQIVFSWRKETKETSVSSFILSDVDGKAIDQNLLKDEPSGKIGEKTERRFLANKKIAGKVAYFEFIIDQGILVIDSIKYLPAGGFSLMDDLQSRWNDPSSELKCDPLKKGFQLSGKGRLETRGNWGDFVLQAKFRTLVDDPQNGCNSGIFFRCIAGSSLDGYECQINNDPPGSDRTRFLGNDTGSIFRRSAARRITDRNNEWTRISLMVNGLIFRTWVNGIPTVCWKDDRPSAPNPRKGSRLEAGTLQLQGHDPWTKIDFEEIKISTSEK